ncbi:MAG TPA: hypothetical protein PKC43_13050, partial [Phycisphaerales bacterium]|nr:hypothetical protein [Phycisphaerales bacterium]HMP38360.1 hypothetical protein [Phycisphaerales bacterium]
MLRSDRRTGSLHPQAKRPVPFTSWTTLATTATAASLVLSVASHGVEIFVDPSATGADDGTSWTDAFVSLQSALGAADTDDEVWIKAGVYKPTSGSDRSESFVVGGFPVYGGFAGTESATNQRNLSMYETVLIGDLSGNDTANFGNRADNSYHIVTIVGGESELSILYGLTIRGGNADGDFFDDNSYGGGVFVGGLHSGEIKVFIRTQCRIEDNSADRAGGGVATGKGAGVELRDSLISGNRTLGDDSGAYFGGGGVSTESLIATRCRFEGNVSFDGPGGALMLEA